MSSPFRIPPEHWARLSALFDQAIELDADERAALLQTLRDTSPEIARELEALLVDAAKSSAAPQTQQTVSNRGVAPFTELLNAALSDGASARLPGETFGAWSLDAKIGSGGMGEVWRAKRIDGLFEGAAAIKLLRSDLAASKLAARFARERSVLARLNHPNIARLLDAGVGGANNDQAFLVLELVDGLPLVDYASAHAPRVADRVRLVRDIARAVDYAHSQLVLHRDIKPSNVLVTANGDVKLLDFGIAAAIDEAATADTSPNLTQLTGRGLTIEYAAPEQIVGDATAAASDTYSLGAVLFHLLTGSHPFASAGNRMALQHAAVNEEAVRASSAARRSRGSDETSKGERATRPVDPAKIDADLDAIVAKSLRKSPAERYASAAALVADLDAWLTQSPISIRGDDRRYRGKLWLKRNWKLAALGGVAAAAVVAGLTVSLWQRSAAIANAAVAKDEAARATKVADYLGELIQSASPDNHGGKWPTVLALLEQSEKDLDQKFRDDPRTYAKLLKQMLDTNDALNRDTIALAQSEKLLELIAKIEPIDRELEIDVLRQKGYLFYRLERYEPAHAAFEQLMPKVVAHYGTEHREYSKAMYWLGAVEAEKGRFDEARALYKESYALLMRLEPDNLRHQLNEANDTTVLYTRQNRWRDAERALASVENLFDRVAATDGASLRDVLIMRNNLEAIRIRIGKYDGAEERLQTNVDAGNRLLGPNNMISIRALGLQASVACGRGEFKRCEEHNRAQYEAIQKRVGVAPSELIEGELNALTAALLIDQAPKAAARDTLRRLLESISTKYAEAGAQRSFVYRVAADAAIRADDLALAREAVSRARADLAAAKARQPERAAQVDSAEAAIAFRSGDPRRAVVLLGERIAINVNNGEMDTPRYAAQLLQRALYEVEFDVVAATKSLAESRAAFERAGGAMPQFKALQAYVEARAARNTTAIRNAENAIDRIFSRQASSPWRLPHLSSL